MFSTSSTGTIGYLYSNNELDSYLTLLEVIMVLNVRTKTVNWKKTRENHYDIG